MRSLFFCILMFSGCQQLNLFHWNAHKIPSSGPENPVVEMVCLWEPAEGVGRDGFPTRGFAGQILFFSAKTKEPVKVDGNIRIYLFDNLGTPEEQSRPLHQYDFDSTSFQAFLNDSNLGASYQLFVPYPRKGGHKATCTLRIRFEPPEGRTVYSKMASVILPGPDFQPHAEITQTVKPKRVIHQNQDAKQGEPIETVSMSSSDLHESQNTPSAASTLQLTPQTAAVDRELLKRRLSRIADSTVPVSAHDVDAPPRNSFTETATEHPLLPTEGAATRDTSRPQRHPLLD